MVLVIFQVGNGVDDDIHSHAAQRGDMVSNETNGDAKQIKHGQRNRDGNKHGSDGGVSQRDQCGSRGA